MLGRLMPREGKFFDLFNAHAERIVEGSRELATMIGTFSELEAHAQRIDAAERAADKITHETITLRRDEGFVQQGNRLERAADKITHETITLLPQTFLTPFD